MQNAVFLLGLFATGVLMFFAGYFLHLSTNKPWLKRLLLIFVLIYSLQMGLLVADLAGFEALQILRILLATTIPPFGYYCFSLSLRGSDRPQIKDIGYLLPISVIGIVLLLPIDSSKLWIDPMLAVNELFFGARLFLLSRQIDPATQSKWRKTAVAVATLFVVLAMMDILIYLELQIIFQLSQSISLMVALWLVNGFWLLSLIFIVHNRELMNFIDNRVSHTNELVAQIIPTTMSVQEAAIISSKVTQLLENNQFYLQEDCNLINLSKALHLTSRQVSSAINMNLKKGFSTLINDFKVQHAVKLLTDEAWSHLPIVTIMYESGFRTKSSFNKEFSRRMQQSPSEFRKISDCNK